MNTMDWDSALRKLEGAYANGTLRAYRSDIQGYVKWCVLENLIPFPASPQSLVNYIQIQSQEYAASTIKRRLAAVGKIHEILELNNPNSNSEVKLSLKRALRSKSLRPRQAIGLNATMRDQLINACNNSLAGKRDKALISLGYDTLCRRSELVAIQIGDVEFCDRDCGKIIIRRSKNDQLGVGRTAYISPRSIQYLKSWLKESNLENGPLFRAVKKNNIQPNGIHPHTVNRILKKCANSAGMPDTIVCRLSGHSMRIGAAQEMMKLGFDILPIMVAGGWKTTNVVARYIESADMSHLLRKFHNN